MSEGKLVSRNQLVIWARYVKGGTSEPSNESINRIVNTATNTLDNVIKDPKQLVSPRLMDSVNKQQMMARFVNLAVFLETQGLNRDLPSVDDALEKLEGNKDLFPVDYFESLKAILQRQRLTEVPMEGALEDDLFSER